MRRFVDTLILVLVAYSVCWPLARSFVTEDTDGPRDAVVTVRIPDCDVTPEATVRIAKSEADAAAGHWIVETTQATGSAGAGLHAPRHGPSVWVAVELAGCTLDAREVPLDADAPRIEITTPPDARAVTGRVATGDHPSVRVTVRSGCEPASFDVPCDPAGRFAFVLPSGDADALAIHAVDGQLLARRALVAAAAGVLDLGDLED